MKQKEWEHVDYLEQSKVLYLVTAKSFIVSEEGMPGVSLNGQKAEQLKVVKLKYWLRCKVLPTIVNKADLVMW